MAQDDSGLMAEWLHLCNFGMYEGFSDAADVASNFHVDPENMGGIIAAIYNQEGYEGNAVVVLVREGKLYEVHGSHCSCNGLEGQWSEEETTVAALRIRGYPGRDYKDPPNYQSKEEQKYYTLLDLLDVLEKAHEHHGDTNTTDT